MATIVSLAAFAAPAGASVYRVTTTQHTPSTQCKPSSCSLRAAVAKANSHPGADRVVIKPGRTYTLGSAGELRVTGRTTIRPGGDRAATVDAGDVDRPLEIGAPFRKVTLKRLVLTGGTSSSPGAGLTVTRGHLQLVASRVLGNDSSSGGGGVWVAAAGVADIVRSTISGNTSSGVGGGLGVFGVARVNHSTIANNSTGNFGGGVSVGYAAPAHFVATNSTIAGNHAAQDSGGIFGGYYTKLNAVTVAYNEANTDQFISDGGGIVNPYQQGTFLLANTIVASNTVGAGGSDPDCAGGFTSNGANLIGDLGDPNACQGFGQGDITGQSAGLATLADNGGPTRTVALQPGSLATGAADPVSAPGTDQRYVARDAQPDIGAFEVSGP